MSEYVMMRSGDYDRLFGAGAPHGDSFGCDEGMFCAACDSADNCNIVCDLPEAWHEAWERFKEEDGEES